MSVLRHPFDVTTSVSPCLRGSSSVKAATNESDDQLSRFICARAEALEDAITDAKRVGHDRERRVDGPARWEEAAVDDIQICDVVRLARRIQRRRARIVAEANRAVLMRDAG